MPITHTNRQGITYTLCRGTTKTGKPRYYFAREPQGQPVEQLPEGYDIRESVNGVVSLAKTRPNLIRPEETAVVEAALRKHPKRYRYGVDTRSDQIVVFEKMGADLAELARGLLGDGSGRDPAALGQVRELEERWAQFAPVLRFILQDETRRTFRVQRMSWYGAGESWRDLMGSGPIFRLAPQLIARLGTDAFYELF